MSFGGSMISVMPFQLDRVVIHTLPLAAAHSSYRSDRCA